MFLGAHLEKTYVFCFTVVAALSENCDKSLVLSSAVLVTGLQSRINSFYYNLIN